MEILFVNTCVREDSRTLRLAQCYLSHLQGRICELKLAEEPLQPLDAAALNRRSLLLEQGHFEDSSLRYARQFAAADEIVIAAPYWDLSFPSLLKVYLERVCAIPVTFRYDEHDRPVGLCRAKRLSYLMTAGGPILPPNHGYLYVKDLAQNFFGIPETKLFAAELLDIAGRDPELQLQKAIKQVEEYFA